MEINQCDCCKEIWNRDNLKPLLVGDTNMFLCPDCFENFNNDFIKRSKLDEAIEEIMQYVKYCDENVQAPLVSKALEIFKRNIGG